jgi:hypothetical protein
VTTLHFESSSKGDVKESIQASPKQVSPVAPRSFPPSEQRAVASSVGGTGGASLSEALCIIGSIGTAPLSLESIVERCDAAAIALTGCTRTRLFVLSEVLDDESYVDGRASAQGPRQGERMRALQVGAPHADHSVCGCAGTCIRTQQLLLYNDIAAATDFVSSMEGCGARPPISQVFAPIFIPGSLHSKRTTLGALQVRMHAFCVAFFLVHVINLSDLLNFSLCR